MTTKFSNIEVVFFIVSLPFLWVLWHLVPEHRSHFWSDMKQVVE